MFLIPRFMTMEVEEHNLSHLLPTPIPLQKLEQGKSLIPRFVILHFSFSYACVSVSIL